MPSSRDNTVQSSLTNYVVAPTFEFFPITSGSSVSLPTSASRGWFTSSAVNFTADVRNDNGFRSTQALRLTATSAAPTGKVVGSLRAIAAVDTSKSLTISFNYRTASSYASGDWTVVVRDTTNSTTITPAVTAIPASTSDVTFTTTFVSSSSTAYEVWLVPAATVVNGGVINIDNFSLGPNEVIQGVPVSDWQAFTPTFAGLSVGNGTVYGVYRRVGDTMEMLVSLIFGTTTSVSGTIVANLPTGYTIDSTKTDTLSNVRGLVGLATAQDDSANLYYDGNILINSSTSVCIRPTDAAGSVWVAAVPFTWATADEFALKISVPIAEWAGSTVGLANSRVEYAYNSAAWGDSSDSTSFGYGPDGVAFAATDLTDTRTRRIRFGTPIQSTDQITVQIKLNGVWIDVGSAVSTVTANYSIMDYQPRANSSGATGGIGLRPVSASTTDVDVYFGRYGFASVDGSADIGWSSLVSSSNSWRVVKSSNPLSIGSELTTPYQIKTLSADVTTNATDFLTFNNLTIGKTYRYSGTVAVDTSAATTANDIAFHIQHGGSDVKKLYTLIDSVASSSGISVSMSFSHTFVATQTTINLESQNLSASESILASVSGINATWAMLEELPHHIAVTTWT